MSLSDDFASNAGIPASRQMPSYGTPDKLLDNLVQVESSGGKNNYNTKSGATGPYQFLPGTVAQLKKEGVSFDPNDMQQSRMAADYLIQKNLKQNGGDYHKAVASYGGFIKEDPSQYVGKVMNGVDVASPQVPNASRAPNAPQAAPSSSLASQFESDAQISKLSSQFTNDANPSAASNVKQNSTVDNVLSGVKHGAYSMVANTKQGLDMAANYAQQKVSGTPIGNAIDYLNDKLGFSTPQQALSGTNQAIAKNNKDFAPAANTTAGKIGDFVGQVAALAPTALIPGSSSLAGMGTIGAASGLATTEGGLADRAQGAVGGAIGGALGYGVGKAINAGASKLGDVLAKSTASQDAATAGKTEMVKLADQYGLKLPSAASNPSTLNRMVNGFTGQAQNNQIASSLNQPIINNIAKQELEKTGFGLGSGAPLSLDYLSGVRQKAGEAYKEMGNIGVIKPTQSFYDTIDALKQKTTGFTKSFPDIGADDVSKINKTLDGIKMSSFTSEDAIGLTQHLREIADMAYRSGAGKTGAVYKDASNALEGAIETHLHDSGNVQALTNFRNARETIAKSYSIEKAMNPATGDIDASKLSSQFLKNPNKLTGGLKDVAQLATAFPKPMKLLNEPYKSISPGDIALGALTSMGTAASGGGLLSGLAALDTLARPGLRSLMMTKPMQKLNTALGTNHYARDLMSNGILPAAQSTTLSDLAGIGGAVVGKNRD